MMKCKALFFSALCIVFVSGCRNSSEPSANTEDSLEILEEENPAMPKPKQLFPEWFRYLHLQDTSFSETGFKGGEMNIKTDSADREVDEEQLKPFIPYLLFNADSSLAIDLVSYNYIPITKGGKTKLEEAGPDFEVALIDFKNKKRKQLLFFGTMGTIMDAKWENDHTIVLAGANEWVGADSLLPVMWKYEIPSGSWQVYTFNRMIHADWTGYRGQWREKISSKLKAQNNEL